MDLRHDLKEQYHAALAMLAECVQRCPDDLWTAGSHPRTFWRIAFHAAFFAQLYLGQDTAAFQAWGAAPPEFQALWDSSMTLEPFEMEEHVRPISRREALDYIAFTDELVDPVIDGLDLDSPEPGFWWYKGISKLSHEMMSLRHIQGHIGQLSELLMARGLDTDWIARPRRS
jgi:hypothetical protein